MNDDEIEAIRKLKKGREEGFSFFFYKYYDRLVAYIITFINDQKKAEDIVQEAFMKFWNNKKKLDPQNSPKSYLYRIAYNEFIDTVNKNKREKHFLEDVWKASIHNLIEDKESLLEQKIKKMNEVINDLPPKCKQIILLNKMEGLKYKEIAKKLDISVKTVEAQMRIAFKKIRKEFKDDSQFFFLLILDKIRKNQKLVKDFSSLHLKGIL